MSALGDHYKKATETIRTWPFWKRTILGPATPEDLKAARENLAKLEGKDVEDGQ